MDFQFDVSGFKSIKTPMIIVSQIAIINTK